MTFRNVPVIDYSIVSHHALQFISMLDILEVDPPIFDGHSFLVQPYVFLKVLH